MSLVKSTVVSVYGRDLVFENAYYMIKSVFYNKLSLNISVLVFDDVNKNNSLFEESYTLEASVQDGSPNFIKQGYEYLKTLPEFADAIDA